MSATGRNTEDKPRDPFDWYRTPDWCVKRLLEADPWIRSVKSLLSPTAGDGAILKALDIQRGSARGFTPVDPISIHAANRTVAWEIQPRFETDLKSLLPSMNVVIGDALKLAKQTLDLRSDFMQAGLLKRRVRFDLALDNPPFDIAFELLQALWPICDVIGFLLRVSFLGSEERQPFLSAHPPGLRILPNRPQFKWGGSDNCEYAWMFWDTTEDQTHRTIPTVKILGLTPLDVRQRDRGLNPNHSKPRRKRAVGVTA